MSRNAIRSALNRVGSARLRHFFHDLGPRLITGAADDDPSGISTYSVAGAAFGFAQLWIALVSFPLMAAVQLMCARLGMVTGLGLASVVRRRYSRAVLWGACLLLLVANTVNVGADLGGMAEAMQMVSGISSYFWLPLFAFLITAFLARPHWREVLTGTFFPHIEWTAGYLATVLGVLGTTISPYLFFWQAAQEVEEERSMGRKTVRARRGATDEELRSARTDVMTGMAFSNLVMYFIILATGATLYVSGHRDIETARQAAEALRPLAGPGAYWLFTLGLIGTGMLGVPVLAGSAAYAVAEAMHWRGSLEDRPRRAPKFYAVLAVAVLLGLVLNYVKLNAVRMLFWAAVLNGMLAAPLIILVTLLCSDRSVMGARVNPFILTILGWLTAAVMLAATLMMFVTWGR